MDIPVTPRRIRFGEFAADLVSGELRKEGCDHRILLQDQPLAILRALVAKPGEMVTREALIQLLWSGNTNVDFDPSLNKAVNRLRESLGDSAETPRYIETIARRGYRFIAKIEVIPAPAGGASSRLSLWKTAVWIAAGAACLLVALLIYRKIGPQPDAPAITPVPFTAYPGFEDCPTFSPDGSQIAFAWNGDPGLGAQDFDLYVKVIGSENLLRLTRQPSERICPAWSPDGRQIAFNRDSGTEAGIYVVPALGGPERRLRSIRPRGPADFDRTTPISWSPNGKSIAFVDFLPPDNNFRINLLSLETLESNQISHAPECINGWLPAFSHSGNQLAYVCVLKFDDRECGIYTIPSSGGLPVLVTRFKTGLSFPQGIAWTADDKKLIVSRTHLGDDFELDEVTLADGSLQKLSFGQDARSPAISPKGDKLAFAVRPYHHVDIWRKDLLHPEAAAVKLIFSTRSQVIPQYSPDGTHIAFTSNQAGPWEVWMSDADGTHLVKLSDARSSNALYPRWSPDSQKVAFDSRHSDHPEVYIVDISERLPRRVVTNLPNMSKPSWSHDGRWLYFQSSATPTEGSRIFRCPVSGGNAVALSAKSGYSPWESYDGETLYFTNSDNGSIVQMLPLQVPGKESPLQGMPVVFDASEWTVVPRGIYFVPANAPKSVWYFDFASKQVRPIFAVDKYFDDSLSVSPDGRWILYTQMDEMTQDIMLVENLR